MYKIIGADNREYGPVPLETLRQWIAEGRANSKTMVLKEGESSWRPLSSFPELVCFSGTQPPVAKPAIGAPQPAQTNGFAIASLVLGCISVVMAWCCCWGFPFNITGIILGAIALSQIQANPNQTGRGLAITGIILSILSIVLGAVFTLIFLSSGGFEEIMREMKRFRV